MLLSPRTAVLASSVLALAAAIPAHADPAVQLSVGTDYSKGKYGAAEDTEQLAVPVAVQVQGKKVWVRASVPYVRVTGPQGVVPGGGNGGVGGPTGGASGLPVLGGLLGGDASDRANGPASDPAQPSRLTRSGIGDVDISAGYTANVGRRNWIGVAGAVKLPTASQDKYLGTSTTDYTVAGEIGHNFGGVALSANGGRRFNGQNAIYPLKDTWQAGAALQAQASQRLVLGFGYSWREAALDTAIPGVTDRSEASASASYRLNKGLSVQGYGYTGFTEGSPDLGAGVQLRYRIGS